MARAREARELLRREERAQCMFVGALLIDITCNEAWIRHTICSFQQALGVQTICNVS